jgi:hypothetical protein
MQRLRRHIHTPSSLQSDRRHCNHTALTALTPPLHHASDATVLPTLLWHPAVAFIRLQYLSLSQGKLLSLPVTGHRTYACQ